MFKFTIKLTSGLQQEKAEVDKVIEDEITRKLAEDLLQSVEKKFLIDLEKSVDMVLIKIKMMLQNGSTHIEEKLTDLQQIIEDLKETNFQEVIITFVNNQNYFLKFMYKYFVIFKLIFHKNELSLLKRVSIKKMLCRW